MIQKYLKTLLSFDEWFRRCCCCCWWWCYCCWCCCRCPLPKFELKWGRVSVDECSEDESQFPLPTMDGDAMFDYFQQTFGFDRKQVSISSTLYVQIFRMNIIFLLTLWLCQKIRTKNAHKKHWWNWRQVFCKSGKQFNERFSTWGSWETSKWHVQIVILLRLYNGLDVENLCFSK